MALLRRVRASRRRSALGFFRPGSEVFRLFAAAGANMERAAGLGSSLFERWPEGRELREEITACESRGDQITREIIRMLHRSRLAPFDRNEIYDLAQTIDDVVDEIEEATGELAAYGIEAPMEQAQELAAIARDSARVVSNAIAGLAGLPDLEREALAVRDLEHDGDRVYRQAVTSLFDRGIDPMLVLRWKGVFQGLEDAIDSTRHAMNVLQGITVKYH